jgi:hypothetical protein
MPARIRKVTDNRPTDDLIALVRTARPIALQCLVEGLGEHDETLFTTIEQFTRESVGDDRPLEIGDDEFPRLIDLALHAYAVGIALGLLLRPELFAKGGTR